MNISPQELAQRLAEADRHRVALRRATLELAAMGDNYLSSAANAKAMTIDLNDRTESGRILRVIYVRDPKPDSVFVVTAYELSGKPLVAFRRRMKKKRK